MVMQLGRGQSPRRQVAEGSSYGICLDPEQTDAALLAEQWPIQTPAISYGSAASWQGSSSEGMLPAQISQSLIPQVAPGFASHATQMPTGDTYVAHVPTIADAHPDGNQPSLTPADQWPRHFAESLRSSQLETRAASPAPAMKLEVAFSAAVPLTTGSDLREATDRPQISNSDTMLDKGNDADQGVAFRKFVCDAPDCRHVDYYRMTARSPKQSPDQPYGHLYPCRLTVAKLEKVDKSRVQGVCRSRHCERQPHVRLGTHLGGRNGDQCNTSAPARLAAQITSLSWIDGSPGAYTVTCSVPECLWMGFMGQITKSMKDRYGELPDFFAHTDACRDEVISTQGLLSGRRGGRWCSRGDCEQGWPQGHVGRSTAQMSKEDPSVCSKHTHMWRNQ